MALDLYFQWLEWKNHELVFAPLPFQYLPALIIENCLF
jgi:hypothetical protein